MAIVIGGPTAAAWVQSGEDQGIEVTLTADPAGLAPVTYDPLTNGNANIFDATDRDAMIISGPYADTLFGIGVLNTQLSVDNSLGISSPPSEIGFYGDPDLQPILGDDRADILTVSFDKDMRGGSVDVSFFYAGEANTAEQL